MATATRPVSEQIQESLTNAAHSIGFAIDDLQAANRVAEPIMSVLLLQAIKEARELEQFVKQIQSAHKEH